MRLKLTIRRVAPAVTIVCGLLPATPAFAQKATGCLVSDIGHTSVSAKPVMPGGQRGAPATKVLDRVAAADRKAAAEDAQKAVTRSQEEALKKFPASASGGGFLSLFWPSDPEKASAMDQKRIGQAHVFEMSYLNPILQRYSVTCTELRDIVATEQPASTPQPSRGAAPGAR